MTKRKMAESIAQIGSRGNRSEYNRLVEWQMSRTAKQVKESYSRQVAIEATSKSEIAVHCQLSGLRKFRG